MPRIPQKMLNSVVYLYRDAACARKGEGFGGTGFLVGVRSKVNPHSAFCYVVSNWHVACQNHSTVRINTVDGGVEILEFDNVQWHFNAKTQSDIAVIPVALKSELHEYSILTTESFVTKTVFENERIGPGDDVFMIGRFIDHDGKVRNRPSVRFGNISMNPTPIPQPYGPVAEAYCIDLHSRQGYSGSPVFVYRTPGSDLTVRRPAQLTKDTELLILGPTLFGLLGIHYAQFPELWEVTGDGVLKNDSESEPLLAGRKFIKGLSGMTCVLPAWEIMEVLTLPELKKEREMAEKEMKETEQHDTTKPVAEDLSGTEEGDEVLRRMLNTPPKPRR